MEKVNHQPVSHQLEESFSFQSFLTETLSRCLLLGRFLIEPKWRLSFQCRLLQLGKKHSNIQHQRFKDALRSPKCFNLSQNENEMVGVTVQKKPLGHH